jgi:atypical dual specificity phosphatase
MLRNDAIKLCQENNFNTGYFEGSDSNCVVDAYELKVIDPCMVQVAYLR